MSTDENISDATDPTVTTNSITTMPQKISNQSVSSLSTGVDKIVSDIKQLQTTEMQLYTTLDDQNLSQDQRTNIINQINDIGQTRSTLYNSLKNMASSYQQNVSTSQDTIQQQMFAVDIVENELNEAKVRMQALENDKYNKLRLVEINTYYSKRFGAHKEIVKTVVYVCIFMLIIIILGKKEIIPRNIYIVLNGMVIVIGVIIIGKKMIDLSNRDNMNYDEYNWYFDKEKAPSDTGGSGSATTQPTDPWASTTADCVGGMCCTATPGLMYDSVNKVCVVSTSTDTTTTDTTTMDTTTMDTSTTDTTTTESMNNMNPYLRSTAFQNW